MSRIIIAMVMVALMTLPAGAQKYPEGGHVVSLWDSRYETTNCEYFGSERHYVNQWLQPGPDGSFGGEWKLVPADWPEDEMFVSRTTKNTVISDAMLGTWYGPPGISFGFLACQTNLVWLVELRVEALGWDVPGYYTIEGHDDTGDIICASCLPGRKEQMASAYNQYGFNAPCVVSTQETSWGAIKNMMK